MTTSPARKLSSALQGGFLLQVLQEENEHQKIVSGSAKQFSTYSHIENNANTIKSADVFHGASQHRNQAFCIEYFYCFSAALTKHFPWHVLSKQRSCAPFNGIPINTDVGNPTTPFTTALERQASFMRQVGTHNGIRLYKGIKIFLSHLRLLPPLPIHLLHTQAPTPKSALSSSTYSSDVRSGRQVDGFLRHGGTN